MTLYTLQEVNIRKTYLFLFIFLILVITLGWFLSYVFADNTILIAAVILSVFSALYSYWNSDKVILSLSGAKPATKDNFPELFRIVENLSITAGLPTPKIYVIEDTSPNAFATGRDPQHSAICVTTGLLRLLEKSELEGVIAHELSHIGNRDILLMSIVVILVGIVGLLSRWFISGVRWRDNRRGEGGQILLLLGLIMIILAPLTATLLKLAISRKREFLADATGALLTRYPKGLARALEKISQYPYSMKNANTATAHLFIVNPFRGKERKSWLTRLFMTHPPVEERIKALRQMSIG
ncbi:M48 family metalloprotease [bacterium]|nr:M48 family metalloprotease [bacterium]